MNQKVAISICSSSQTTCIIKIRVFMNQLVSGISFCYRLRDRLEGVFHYIWWYQLAGDKAIRKVNKGFCE